MLYEVITSTELEAVLGLDKTDDLPVESISWEEMLSSTPITNPYEKLTELDLRITSYNVCYTKLLRTDLLSFSCATRAEGQIKIINRRIKTPLFMKW